MLRNPCFNLRFHHLNNVVPKNGPLICLSRTCTQLPKGMLQYITALISSSEP
jgi:hypothetical protein